MWQYWKFTVSVNKLPTTTRWSKHQLVLTAYILSFSLDIQYDRVQMSKAKNVMSWVYRRTGIHRWFKCWWKPQDECKGQQELFVYSDSFKNSFNRTLNLNIRPKQPKRFSVKRWNSLDWCSYSPDIKLIELAKDQLKSRETNVKIESGCSEGLREHHQGRCKTSVVYCMSWTLQEVIGGKEFSTGYSVKMI